MRVFNRPVPLLTAAIGVIGANSLVLSPIAPAVAADLSSDTTTILKAVAAYGAGTAISALTLAPRADVIGSDRSLKHACLLLLFALLMCTLGTDVRFLILGQAIAGVGAGLALPSIYSLAAHVSPKGRERKTISTVLTGWTLSLIFGVTFAAVIADMIGWRAVYGLMTVLTLGVLVLLKRCDMKVGRREGPVSSPLSALRQPGILRGLFSNAMLMLAFNGAYIYMGAHVVQNMGLTTSATGVLTMLYGLGFGGAVIFNRFLEGLPARWIGLLAFGGLAVTYLAMDQFSLQMAVLLPLAFLWGIFQHFALNTVVDRLTSLDPNRRGAIMGLNAAVTYGTVMGGSVFFRYPFEYGGLGTCLGISALFAAIAAAEAIWPSRPVKTCSIAE